MLRMTNHRLWPGASHRIVVFMDISYAVNNPDAVTIAKGQTVRIKGHRGRIVHCLQGQIWLTQHGVFEDYFLPGGTSYRSAGDGLILVNSCDVVSVIAVRDHASKAGIDVGPVRIESIEQLDRGARRARALSLSKVLCILGKPDD
jgi:Protein of unknown function (DUF2917)